MSEDEPQQDDELSPQTQKVLGLGCLEEGTRGFVALIYGATTIVCAKYAKDAFVAHAGKDTSAEYLVPLLKRGSTVTVLVLLALFVAASVVLFIWNRQLADRIDDLIERLDSE